MGKYRFPLKKFYNIDYWTDRTNEIVKQTYSSRFWYVQTVSPNIRDYSIGTRTEFVLSNSSDIRTLSNNAKLASLKYEHKYYFVRQSMFFQRKIKPGLIEKCKSLSLSLHAKVRILNYSNGFNGSKSIYIKTCLNQSGQMLE